MEEVYVVQHLREDADGYDDVKFIGVYSTLEKAQEAIHRLQFLPGFSSTREGFDVQRYCVDEDHWTEGFVDLSTDGKDGNGKGDTHNRR
jgi:hypothetical protein